MIVSVPTQRYGLISFVTDIENLDLLKYLRLTVQKTETNDFYIMTSDKNRFYIHRLITKAPKGFHVHHINGNTLDNRKCNLKVLKPKLHSIETAKVNANLKEHQIKEILLSNKSDKAIMQKYNITLTMLSNIRRGKAYTWCCPEIKRQENKHKRHTKKILQQIKYHVLNGFNLKALSLIYDIALNDLYRMRRGTAYKSIEPAL